MDSCPVELRVGGHTYRVVSSASERELERLASVVDEKLEALGAKGHPLPVNVWVLVAIALAHDVQAERDRRLALEARGRDMLQSLLERIDAALDSDGSEPPPRDDLGPPEQALCDG
jgi:cell division protein ZapA